MKKKQSNKNLIPVSRIRATLRRIWWLYSLKRKEALRKAQGVCQICGALGKKLQVHHTTQLGAPKNWDKWIKKLFKGKQIAICEDCHKLKSKKERSNGKDNRLQQKKKRTRSKT